MLIVHVFVNVKNEYIEAFKTATIENASQSVKEPGIARFDLIWEQDDPTKFVLVEVYRNKEATLKHKETAHYKKWRDTVESMMEKPRTSIKYINIFPDENGWG